MSRTRAIRTIGLAVWGLFGVSAGIARAQEAGEPAGIDPSSLVDVDGEQDQDQEGGSDEAVAPPAPWTPSAPPATAAAPAPPAPPRPAPEPGEGTVAPRGDKRIGPRLGIAIGALSGVSPGGLRLGGAFAWRVDHRFWLDVEGGVRFGSGGAACYTGRGDARPFRCDHGSFDGNELEALVGLRMPLGSWPGGLEPYVRGGAGLGLITFSDDDVSGVSLPLWAGAGGRMRLSDGVAAIAEVTVMLGPGWFDGLDVEPIGALVIQGGVEFDL